MRIYEMFLDIILQFFTSILQAKDSLTYDGENHDLDIPNHDANNLAIPEIITDVGEKKFYHALSLNKTVEEGDVLTRSEKWIKRIKEFSMFGSTLFGRGLGLILDFVFSMNFVRLTIVISCIAGLFSPLGPIIGGVAFGLGCLNITYSLVRDTITYRNVRQARERYALLTEIESLLSQEPLLLSIISKTAPAQYKQPPESVAFTSPSVLKTIGIAMMGEYPSNVFNLGVSIATLSPIGILLNLLGLVTASAAETSHKYQLAKLQGYLEHIADIKQSALGIQDFDLEGLRRYYDALSVCNAAVQDCRRESPSVEPQHDRIVAKIPEFSKKIEPVRAQSNAFLQDMWTMLKADFTWATRNRLFAPALAERSMQDYYVTFKTQYQPEQNLDKNNHSTVSKRQHHQQYVQHGGIGGRLT